MLYVSNGHFCVFFHSPQAGSALSELITGFLRFGMQLHSLVVVGHSLGAHIAGMAGKKLIANQRVRIAAIIGLDPAGVLFDVNETNYRLADTDADYVQVIHTDIDDGRVALGIGQPIGHGKWINCFKFFGTSHMVLINCPLFR